MINVDSYTALAIAKVVGMALGGIVPAYSIGRIGSEALKALGRNPQANVSSPMILGMALAEAIAIYTLLVIMAFAK